MEFLATYGLFLAKALTLFTLVGVLLAFVFGQIAGLFERRRHTGITVTHLNDEYADMRITLERALLPKRTWKKNIKAERARRKQAAKSDASALDRKRMFVIDFRGDIRATGVDRLRHEITTVLSQATGTDEIVIRLENQGGTVHEHGLAASQLMRIREAKVPLTICVDKVAASGGYMMACVANKLLAAPFAIIGSIGVIAQLPNFHRVLKDKGIDVEQITAGKYKRTVTMFGKNTDEDRAKLSEELDQIHQLFKQLVTEHRPQLNIEKVSTGEHWYGKQALDLGLIDGLTSSDDYLVRATHDADVVHVSYYGPRRLQERALQAAQETGEWLRRAF